MLYEVDVLLLQGGGEVIRHGAWRDLGELRFKTNGQDDISASERRGAVLIPTKRKSGVRLKYFGILSLVLVSYMEAGEVRSNARLKSVNIVCGFFFQLRRI